MFWPFNWHNFFYLYLSLIFCFCCFVTHSNNLHTTKKVFFLMYWCWYWSSTIAQFEKKNKEKNTLWKYAIISCVESMIYLLIYTQKHNWAQINFFFFYFFKIFFWIDLICGILLLPFLTKPPCVKAEETTNKVDAVTFLCV